MSDGQARQPNFLFVITDQHRADHVGFGGNAVVRTPHLDALAARGRVFRSAYVSNPICMPNRATILTSRVPSAHGTRHNGVALGWDTNTFVRRLRSAGYATALVGKAHFQNMGIGSLGATSVERGSAREDARRPDWPAGWDDWENQDAHRGRLLELPPDFYGFDDVRLTVNHADYCSGHYHHWLKEHGVEPAEWQGIGNALEVSSLWNEVYRPRLPVELYPTSYIAEQTREVLATAATTGRPFFLQCSFPDPHHPFTPPGEYFDMYDPAEMPLPETFNDAHEGSPPHLRRLVAARGTQAGPMSPWSPTEDQYREIVARQYGSISLIDHAVGDILDTLETLGLADDTYVVMTADHGDLLGDHGLMLKGMMHYRGLTRVPLVVAGPGIIPGEVDATVGSIDLAPTILDLAGVAGFAGMQGDSLAPALAGGEPAGRPAYIEEDWPFDLLGTGRPLRMRTVQTPTCRLTHYEGSTDGELYDLADDPDETRNLYADASARALRAEMYELLACMQLRFAETSPQPTHLG